MSRIRERQSPSRPRLRRQALCLAAAAIAIYVAYIAWLIVRGSGQG